MLVKWMNYLILCCRKSLGREYILFSHYEDEDIDGSVSEFDGDTTF